MKRLHRRRFFAFTLCLLSLYSFAVAWYVASQTHQLRQNQALLAAIKKNNLSAVTYLLGHGADPNARDSGQSTTSVLAILAQAIDRLRGKQPLASDAPSALMVALDSWWKPEGGTDEPAANTAIVKLLLSRGASVNCRGNEGVTPLIDAALSNRAEIVRALIDRGAAVNAKDDYGYSALDYVSGYHQHSYHETILQILRQAGASD